jgi:uncharacterized protein (TIGR02646 family)
MTRFDRPPAEPGPLQKGIAVVAALEDLVQLDPQRAGTADAPFEFDSNIYGHKTVKTALKKAQHDKCAYCENHFAGNSSGDIEHFRPKAYSQQSAGARKSYPGYYWLAYTWTNLLYSCEICNRRVKRNLFPLTNPASRARHRTDDIGAEQPMLIDPAGPHDPRDHIGFRHAKPFAKTSRGQATIEAFALDRTELDDPRLRHLQLVGALKIIASLDPTDARLNANVVQEIHKARAALLKLIRPEAVFSVMTADFLNSVP